MPQLDFTALANEAIPKQSTGGAGVDRQPVATAMPVTYIGELGSVLRLFAERAKANFEGVGLNTQVSIIIAPMVPERIATYSVNKAETVKDANGVDVPNPKKGQITETEYYMAIPNEENQNPAYQPVNIVFPDGSVRLNKGIVLAPGLKVISKNRTQYASLDLYNEALAKLNAVETEESDGTAVEGTHPE